MEYFHSKLADLQPEKKILNKKDPVLHEIFLNSLSVENLVTAALFSYTV